MPSGYMQWLRVGTGLPAWNQVLTCSPPPAMEALSQLSLLGYMRCELGARSSLWWLQFGGAQQISQPAKKLYVLSRLHLEEGDLLDWAVVRASQPFFPYLSHHISHELPVSNSLLPGFPASTWCISTSAKLIRSWLCQSVMYLPH